MSTKREQKAKTMAISEQKANDFFETGLQDGLSILQLNFAREYLVDYNGTQAAIRAGYSPKSAAECASQLLKLSKIRNFIAKKQRRNAEAAEVDGALVISEIAQLALADPSDLMRVEVDCCRYCHGIEHRRMWTPGEYTRDLSKAFADGKPAPDVAGGIGYDPRKEPHPECPECFGRGVDRVVITPSKKLSRGARRLMAAVKQTKDGIEIKVHDQLAALIALGRVTGSFVDRSEHSGPGGGPLQLQPVPLAQLSPLQLEAILKASGHPVLQGHKGGPITPQQIEAITGTGDSTP